MTVFFPYSMGLYFPHISVISLYCPERTYVYCDLPLFLVDFDKFVSLFTAHNDMKIWTMRGLGFQNWEHKYLRGAASSIIGKMENHCGGLMLTLTVPGMYTLNRNQLQSSMKIESYKKVSKMAAFSDREEIEGATITDRRR